MRRHPYALGAAHAALFLGTTGASAEDAPQSPRPAAPLAAPPEARRALFSDGAAPPGRWASSPPLAPVRTDPLMGMGIALTSLGAAGLIASSVMLATSKEPPAVCDPCSGGACPFPPSGGCAMPPQTSAQRLAGSGLFGGSLVTVLMGVPVLAVGAIQEAPELGERQSDAALLATVAIATLSVASTAAGAFIGLAKTRYEGFDVAPTLSLLGTAGMLVTIPLWAGSAKRRSPPGENGLPLVPRSRRLALGGLTLTMLGAGIAGSGAIIQAAAGGDEGVRIFSGSLAFASIGMALAGIPMWYVGQEKVPATAPLPPPSEYTVPREGAARPAATAAREKPELDRETLSPTVALGPTSVAVHFRF